jgi:hypothetical protein
MAYGITLLISLICSCYSREERFQIPHKQAFTKEITSFSSYPMLLLHLSTGERPGARPLSIVKRFMSLTGSPPSGRDDPLKTALRQQRKRAIETCDFPKAKVIDLQLKRINTEKDETAASQQVLQNQVEYSKVKDSVHADADRAYSDAIEKIYHIESEFEGRLAVLISEHAEELAAHATSLAAELELSSIRPVPDSLVMTSEAKTVAKIGEFDRAQSLYQTSTDVHAQTVADRHAEVREVYERLQKQLDAHHAEDLKRNAEK